MSQDQIRVGGRYDKSVDRESAHVVLMQRAAKVDRTETGKKKSKRSPGGQGDGEAMTKSV